MRGTTEPAQTRDAADSPEPGARMFVVGLGVALAVAAVGFVLKYGATFPRWDDFAMVPVLVGEQPITVEWLWSQHNEHRIPLSKLILAGLLRVSRGDFRAGMLFSVATLAILAAGLSFTARRARGWVRASDAIFPLVLLNLGHHANLLWGWQIALVLPTLISGALLGLIVGSASWPSGRRLACAGGCLALLPLSTASGMAWVPAFFLWMLGAAAAGLLRREPGGGRRAIAALVCALPMLVLAGLYFRHYQAAQHHTISGSIVESLLTALRFASLTFGPAGEALWPASGVAVVVLTVLSAAALVRVVAVDPVERPRALGLLAFLAGFVSLALGLGWGRAGGESSGFEARYVTLAAPLVCTYYFVWELYGGPARVRNLVTLALFSTLLVVLWPNTQAGLADGRDLLEQATRVERDVRSGMPAYQFIKRSTPFLHPSEDALAALLSMLQKSGYGLFSTLRPNPPFREESIPVVPTDTVMARWERGTAHVTGPDPQLVFTLPAERYVAGIRLHYSHANPGGTPGRFKFAWRGAGQYEERADRRYTNWNLPTGPDKVTTIWVDDFVAAMKIQPDNQKCEFTLEKIVLLVPVGR